MHVLAIRFDLRLPQPRSLKSKRAVLRPVVEGLRGRFHLSVAEVARHDDHHRSVIGVAIVAGDASQCLRVADEVERFVWNAADIEVLETTRTWTEFDR